MRSKIRIFSDARTYPYKSCRTCHYKWVRVESANPVNEHENPGNEGGVTQSKLGAIMMIEGTGTKTLLRKMYLF
jgi:hypothetical protein